MLINYFSHTKFLGPGEFLWVPFNISIPRGQTVPLELAVLTESTTANDTM